MKKQIKKTIRYMVYIVIVFAIVAAVFFGGDIVNKIQEKRVEYVTVPSKPEVVVQDEFEELVHSFEESEEGKEVLHTWATQQALEVQREKLDTIEGDLLKKEASL